jgi:hypothetical protein
MNANDSGRTEDSPGRNLMILLRQDWFVIDRFNWLAQDVYLFPDQCERRTNRPIRPPRPRSLLASGLDATGSTRVQMTSNSDVSGTTSWRAADC